MSESKIFKKIDKKTLTIRKKKWKLYEEDISVKMDAGFSLFLRPKCEYSRKRFLYRKAEVYDLDFLVNRLNINAEIILDVGANIGYWSSYLAMYKKNIISFEPDPTTYKILEKNLLPFQTYSKLENLAVGNLKGNVDFYLNPIHSGDNSPIKGSENWDKISVPSCDLDSYLVSQKINDVGLIKIDVQGGELNCLKGANRSITTMLPIIVCEISNFSDYRIKLKTELTRYLEEELLNKLGYKPYIISSSGISKVDDLKKINSSNIWFIHEDNSFEALK